MPGRADRAHEPQQYGDQQGAEKEVRRHHEDTSGLADPAQIDDGENQQYAQAQSQGVGLKARNRGNECANARGDTHGHHQNVVQHQRRCGEQSHMRAQIFRGHCVGTSAAGICGDGLAVGEIDDGEQNDNAHADRHNVGHARGAEGNEQRQCRFRSVGCGAERVQTENRNAG